MNKFILFLKKTWWLFLLLFFVPVIVIVYFFILEYGFHRINMTAGEWSSLLGDAFGYWGTVLLGVLAFFQNEQAQENNNILTQYERRKMAPVFAVKVLRYDPILKHINIQIRNCSENIACGFKVYPIIEERINDSKMTVFSKSYEVIHQDKEDFLIPNETVEITFDTPSVSIGQDEKIIFYVSFYAKDIIGLGKETRVKISFNHSMKCTYEYKVIDLYEENADVTVD